MTPPPSSPTHPHHPISILNPLNLQLLDQSKNPPTPFYAQSPPRGGRLKT